VDKTQTHCFYFRLVGLMIVIIPQADEIEIILVHETDTLDDDLPGDD